MPRTRHDINRAAKVDELLDIAEQLFRDRGYARTTVAAVAQAAGVAQNSLYWYFPSKDHLFVAVLDRMLDTMVAEVRSARRRTLVDQILHVAERLEDTQTLGAAVADRARQSEVVAAFAVRMQTAIHDILVEGIKSQAAVDEPELVADTILALAHGTHGMPTRSRRRVLSFGITRILDVAAH